MNSQTTEHAGVGPVVVAVGDALIEGCQQVRALLGRLHAESNDAMPGHFRHEVQQLDDRLAGFLNSYGSGLDQFLRRPDQPSRPAFPPAEEAVGYRLDQWMALIRVRGLSIPAVLAGLQARAEAAGKARPASLRQVHRNQVLTELLLEVIAEQIVEVATR